MLVPLLRQPGVTFHSLQYDADADEVGAISRRAGRPLWLASNVDPRADLDRLAGLISALDLVISTDNTTVHIAGAVGTPCWVMLPPGSDWRWGAEGARTPLYGSLELFRNGWPGWGGVVMDVIEALGRWRAERGA
jgi:ADP-heptose:LPS heptosyltransferase